MDNLVVRRVMEQDFAACLDIESSSFPESEAAGPESLRIRIRDFPQGFYVAERNGRVIGQVNSGATDKQDITEEAFKQLIGHDPAGGNIVIFSLSVLPECRRHGVAARLLERFIMESRAMGKNNVLLLCKEHLVRYYARFGFLDSGVSASTHGGSVWHEMRLPLSD